MITLKQAIARQVLEVADASEIARMARQHDPSILSTDDMQSQLGASALALDGQRRRPRYFDGRFLTGADLTRDQDYIRQRQADLARATGTGVVLGLQVGHGGSPGGETITIERGHGVTPAGDIVMVADRRTIALLDLPSSRRLDATFGVSLKPAQPLGRRSGLFLLVLRPVEFTANPIAAYPTTIDGPRQVEDGDIIEATAIDLIPYPDTGGAATLDEARRTVARRIFLGQAPGMPENALPLAMVALERGSVRWIDMALVRRETGADTPLQVSMGARPRALSEAFVLQHRVHLADVLHDRAAAGLPAAFAASQYFAALPAAGQLPAAAITPDDQGFRQLWFPPSVDVDVSFVPSDEIAALVEESLALPPIDFNGDPGDLDATGIIVLAPVTRQRLQTFERALSRLERAVTADVAQGLRQSPALMLASLAGRRAKALEARSRDALAQAQAAALDAETRAWHTAWAEAVGAIPAAAGQTPLLWYIRRRAVPYESRLAGFAVAASGQDEALKNSVDSRLAALKLGDEFAAVAAKATPFAMARVYALLGGPRISGSTILSAAVMHDLVAAIPVPPANTGIGGGIRGTGIGGPLPVTISASVIAASPAVIASPVASLASGLTIGRLGLTRLTASRAVLAAAMGRATPPDLVSEGDVIAIASAYGDPNLGDGLDRLDAALVATPLGDAQALWLGGSGAALDLDRAARVVGAAALPKFATDVAALATTADAQSVDALKTLIVTAG